MLLATEIALRLLAPKFATYAVVPSCVMARAIGSAPTPMVAITVSFPVLMTDTVLSLKLVT